MSNVNVLQEAIERGCLQTVMAVLDDGVDLEAPDIHGHSGLPLRLACFHGHAEIVAELLRRGAKVDAPNAQGAGAPLRMALRGRHDPVVSLLMAHGAEPPPGVAVTAKLVSTERRRGKDRRVADYGPPKGMRDRRRGEERRVTSVAEMELSQIEWVAYFKSGDYLQTSALPLDEAGDAASIVLERARD